VEALTIVFAVGHTRGWRSALRRAAVVALVVLTALVAAFVRRSCTFRSAPCVSWSAAVLLIFGMQWLRKSILRATGLKAKHDEDAIYEQTVRRVASAGCHKGSRPDRLRDGVQGVFLEGLRVIIPR